eukprot:10283889-Ditylum_brightwellii.AAC.1
MALHVLSDASYLSEKEARSCTGGHFFLSDNLPKYSGTPSKLPTNNGAMHIEYAKIKTAMALTAEAEMGLLFINSKAAVGYA